MAGNTVNIKSKPWPTGKAGGKPSNPASHKGDGSKGPEKPTVR